MPARQADTVRILLTELESRDCPATFTVTNTGDNGGVNPAVGAGTGTLRQAILDANAAAGIDTIAFNIPGTGVQKILPTTQLPFFQEAAVVDGYTQPGSSKNTLAVGDDAKLLIEIDGNGTGGAIVAGLVTRANQYDGMTIRGLSLVNFNNIAVAVRDDSGPYNTWTIEGNFFGVEPDGVTAKPNNANLFLQNDGHRIGGPDPASRNIISASKGHGMTLNVTNSTVQGNYIGTNASGTAAIPNAASGINLLGSGNSLNANVISGNTQNGLLLNGNVTNAIIQKNYIGVAADGVTALKNNQNGILSTSNNGTNLIGGPTAGQANVISGNGSSGLALSSAGQEVRNNFIGTDFTGTKAVPNNLHGIYTDAGGHTITDNVISGNVQDGIHFEISGGTGAGTVITQNRIGTDVTGSVGLGNLGDGIYGGRDVTIGGTTPGVGNTIAFNGKRGVEGISSGIGSATGLQILGNSIFENGDLGIELSGLLTPEEKPALTRVATTATGIKVSGHFLGVAATYRIEFFANLSADPSGFGEGAFFLGSATQTSDGTGLLSFGVDLPATPAGFDVITATVTSQASNQTSEFSNALAAHPTKLVVGGRDGEVRLMDEKGNSIIAFRPLDVVGGAQYKGLVSVALGDVTGDGVADLAVAAAEPVGQDGLTAANAGIVFVYDGVKLTDGDASDALLYSRQPFGVGYTNGVNLAIGNVDGIGVEDLIVGSRGIAGGLGTAEQGRFIVFDGVTGAQIGDSLPAFGEGYQKGCVVAAADLDDDGKTEIVVTRGGPVVNGSDLKVKAFRLTNGTFQLVPGTEIVPFVGIKRGGRVAAVDKNGDGIFEFAISALNPANGSVLVSIFDGQGLQQATYSNPLAPPGTTVDYAMTSIDSDQDGISELVLALDNGTGTGQIIYLDPLTGAKKPGGIDPFTILTNGVTIDGD